MRGVVTGRVRAPVPDGGIDYSVYLPPGYDDAARRGRRFPTLYLLHGRGDSNDDWGRVLPWLDEEIRSAALPAMICVMPDAPWSARASFYVDSESDGGAAVETAFVDVLVPHIDTRFGAPPARARAVAGYSMGGAGALRFTLARPDLFEAAIVLSPAVYDPAPPAGSSAREFGAFGVGRRTFDEARYRQLGYQVALDAVDPALPVRLFIAVGDQEYVNDPEDARHDLDYEAGVLYNRAKRVPGLRAAFRVYGGGHDWSVWERGFREGLRDISAGWWPSPAHAGP
jgi:S-formylglutathione hydrolase FrmB